jgi:ubiquinone/menaquinone biosynthesis C-methylase UbiE
MPIVPSLPYLEKTITLLEAADPEFQQAFGRHWHWGYWDNPTLALETVEDYARAGERMSEHFLDVAGVRDGQRILDAGCGFGGTIAIANARYQGVALTGLNIDPRQLALARKAVVARSGNTIQFVEGDACQPPFPDASFDHVTAVECIFHFPSRHRFFVEAHRLLKPGGILTVSDFIPPWLASNTPLRLLFRLNRVRRTQVWGATQSLEPTIRFYRNEAKRTGFDLVSVEDLTANVQPTHDILSKLTARLGSAFAAEVKGIEGVMKLKLCAYEILVFRRN